MKKAIFTLAIVAAGSFFTTQKTLAQDLAIRTSGPLTIMPNYDLSDPATWIRLVRPQPKPDKGTQLLKTLSAEDGGRKTVALSQHYDFGGASGNWDDNDFYPSDMPF